MPSLTRGPLPASVYWRRRLFLIVLALALVVVLAKLLIGGSDGSSGGAGGAAAQVADEGSPTVTVTVTPTPTPSGSGPAGDASGTASATTTALPDPQGDCAASDVVVTPAVETAYAYDDVTIALQLRTKTSPACTWHVSPDTLQVRISRPAGDVWSTTDCSDAVPATDVVVRRDSTTILPITWAGHRVVAGACSAHSPWVQPGTLAIVASPLGGEPARSTFELLAPGATPPASGEPSGSGTPTGGSSTKSGSATGSPTGGSSTKSGSATGSPTGGSSTKSGASGSPTGASGSPTGKVTPMRR